MIFPQYRKGKVGIDIFPGTILEHARKLGVEIASECGGEGICGKCIVRIERGQDGLSEKTEAEKSFNLGEDERLACQAKVVKPTDIYVFVREMGEYTILADTVEDRMELNPFVYNQIRTTTLVFKVIDLESGERIATISRKNPQASYGDDVISRAGYTMNHEGELKELQQVVVKTINESLQELEGDMGEIRNLIYEAVAVGNSTMRSIFFGIDVSTLCVESL